MSEKKQAHTPGPYRVEGPDYFGDYNILEPNSTSAVGAVVSNGRDPAEVRANADLFGAAAELLEAVKTLRGHLELFCDPEGDDEIARTVFRIADAALAKARPSQVEA